MEVVHKMKLITWLAVRRWWIISAMVFGLMIFEVWEDQSNPSTLYHLLEMFLYIIMLGISGILIGALIRSLQNQHKYLNILDTKHKISLDLAACDDWEALVNQVVEFPVRIAAVDMSCLYLQNPITHEFREIAHWEPGGKTTEEHHSLKACQACLIRQSGHGYAFGECEQSGSGSPALRRFCLPVASGVELVALMQFQTEAGANLSREQTSLFENISDEISVALKAGHDRRVMREISDAEISLNERRKVSYFLHDNLAQNIGYLRLKLDQILTESDHLSPQLFESDLANMQAVANDSFDTVRGILETLTPQNLPGFNSSLRELAQKMGQRARLAIDFQTTGKALELPVDTSQALLYAFQEVLSNIEKHAQATRAEILVQWNPDKLVIRLADNGVGFNPETVDIHKHFGLGILHDRISAVNGRIEIMSREQVGTTVTLSTPLFQVQVAR